YISNSDPEEDEEDLEEDPTDEGDNNDNESFDDDDAVREDEEDEEEEEHLSPTDSIVVASPAINHAPSAKETKPFETDESAATPPPPLAYRITSRMFVRPQTPIPFPSEEVVARLLALPTPPPSPLTPLSSPLPQILSPPMSSPLPPPFLPSPIRPPHTRIPRSTMAHRVDYNFMDTIDASIRASKRKAMAAVEVVNLRVSYLMDVHRRESEEFYSWHQAAQEDRAAVRAKIEALVRYEAHKKTLEVRIDTIETQLYRMEWQRQDTDDCAILHVRRTQALEARARVDTLEDTSSSS
ncbi:hypothetical protein Tco_1580589, partial [Tanacetum coccineum]